MVETRYVPSRTAEKVLRSRYLMKDEAGKVVETPEEMFRRVARHVARAEAAFDRGEVPFVMTPDGPVSLEGDAGTRVFSAEQRHADEFFEAMRSLEFLPNSPTLMNAGTGIGQLAACFVLPLEDSLDGIFETARHAALVFKSGGGVGISFSRLRPRGDAVRSTGGVASGPVSFMRIFDTGADVVKQGGRRRGAMMGALRVDHPDILEFVRCKGEPGRLASFNVSVAVTDAFMAALADDGEYELVNPKTGKLAGRMRASEVLDEIVRCAHATGEPGVLFIDRMNVSNPTPTLGAYETTNPCGETQLLPYESCNLASINLARMVADGKPDSTHLHLTARLATRFLDDVVELNEYPLPEIAELSLANRKIGLGVMGFAEMLIQLGVPYDSDEALDIARRVTFHIERASLVEAKALAMERGPFPSFGRSTLAKGPPIRNATRLAIAPTGTLSIIAGVTGGIEPVFAVGLRRGNILDGSEFFELHPLFEEIARREGFYSDDLVRKIAGAPSIQHLDGIPEHVRRLFRTAHDVAPEWHVRMQAAFQERVDNSVSKTVNLPAEATPDDVKRVFLLAYELGCKGITVYRDGSRNGQPLSSGEAEERAEKHRPRKPRPRPEVLPGRTRKLKTGCGNIFVTITTDDDGRPLELFVKHGKAGVCSQAQCEAIGRLASLALRSDVDPRQIEKQLAGITCHAPFGFGPDKVLSCADAIARAVRLELADEGRDAWAEVSHPVLRTGACPECGAALTHEGHCASCRRCGYTQCG
jgi:ribonucleoside-diphosphate reductase alpha chain